MHAACTAPRYPHPTTVNRIRRGYLESRGAHAITSTCDRNRKHLLVGRLSGGPAITRTHPPAASSRRPSAFGDGRTETSGPHREDSPPCRTLVPDPETSQKPVIQQAHPPLPALVPAPWRPPPTCWPG